MSFIGVCLFLWGFEKPAVAAGVELHAHLFMKEGMGLLFGGDFNGPLRARSWKSRFASQANPESLEQSGLDLVVATLYAHPIFALSLRDSIRKQIQLARRFVREHPNWVLVDHPKKAKEARAAGKKILILALEGASGILETEEDLKEFVDQAGIRIVTFLHLTDDLFGGVAFLDGIRGFSTPWAFFKSLFSPQRDEAGYRINSQGLTDEGKKMALALIQRKVWIDLAHASDRSQEELRPLLAKAGQPSLYTHTVLRKYFQAERAITESQLAHVAQSRGYIGLMPSEEMLKGTPPSEGTCSGSVFALATQFKEVAAVVGESSIGLGSDYNGGIPHLKPSCDTGTSLDQEGLWNIGQSHEVWQALQKLGAVHSDGSSGVDQFLETWSQLWNL
jgi:membrane dipeptidase